MLLKLLLVEILLKLLVVLLLLLKIGAAMTRIGGVFVDVVVELSNRR